MKKALPFLEVTAALILVIMAISWGFSMANKNMKTANAKTAEADALFAGYDNTSATIYDGMTISGDEVKSLISDYVNQSNIEIIVKTSSGSLNSYSAKTTSSFTMGTPAVAVPAKTSYTVTATTAADYINPTGSFMGKVHRNANNAIDYIMFTQQ